MFIVMCTSGWITCWITMYCIFMIFHRQHFAFFIHTITTTTTSTLVLVLTPSPQILISIRWLYALSNSLQHCLWKTCPQGVYRHHPFVDIVSKHIASATRIKGKNGIKGKIKGWIKERMRTARIWQKVGWQRFLSSISKVENDAKNMIKISVNFKNRKKTQKMCLKPKSISILEHETYLNELDIQYWR